MSKRIFLSANYVENFRCKCGDCRNCCCLGWPVTISFNEYNKLLGIKCKRILKEKLDCSFYVLKDCSGERYAEIDRDNNGECKLRDKSGLCALQKNLGEWALPKVCKAYSRNYQNGGISESACANSCEKVIEMLIENSDKLMFREEILDVDIEKYDELPVNLSNIQRKSIEILEDRENSLAIRLIKLRQYLYSEINLNSEKDNIENTDEKSITDISVEVFSKVLSFANYLNNYSKSVCKYGANAVKNICEDKISEEEIFENYKKLKTKLYDKLPLLDIYMEKILINHIFFERFPYSYSNESYLDEYTALLGVYAMTTVASVGYMAQKNTVFDFVDCISGVYRYFEHADFVRLAKKAFMSLGLQSKRKQAELAFI